MKLYRLTYLISPKIEKEDAIQQNKKLVEFIESKKGKIHTKQEVVKRVLAYAIQKERSAYLGDIVFALPLLEILSLKKFIASQKNIERFLLTNTKPIIVKPKHVKRVEKDTKKIDQPESVDQKLNKILED